MSAEHTAPFGAHLRDRRQRGLDRRRRVKTELADHQDGVVSTAQLAELGLTYDEVRSELESGRWHRLGRRTVSVVGDQPPTPRSQRLRALWEVGGGACLDGVTALQAWGLATWSEDVIHVSVTQGSRYRKVPGVRVHVLRDRGAVVTAGIPRTAQEVATLRAAMWARTDRAAATLLAMAVQQRLVDPGRLLEAWGRTGRCPRRGVLAGLVPLVADGAQALSEIDLARLGSARGWPEPDRQVVERTAQGRVYLDVRLTAYDVIAEVNGVQHYQALATMSDALRRNEHAVGDRTALEIPAVALLLDPDPFLDQIEAGLRKGGWPGPGCRPA